MCEPNGGSRKVGDTVTVTLDLHTVARDVKLPPPLALALKKDGLARAAWDALSYTHKREHADAIASAKKPVTRYARLERTLRMLRHGRPPTANPAGTAADARDVMVEGESGLLAISPSWNRPLYEPSKRRLTWPNGAIATLYSAE